MTDMNDLSARVGAILADVDGNDEQKLAKLICAAVLATPLSGKQLMAAMAGAFDTLSKLAQSGRLHS